MSSFKIKLLTPIEAINGSQFLETTISEFYSQTLENQNTNDILNKKNSFSYTFDEKISIHKNGQKELSFSMLKNNWLLDTWEVNPFVNNIHNGTQLLLIDKYENETFFTVTQISYTIKQENIIYNIQCQDSFTYQLIRENDGYTITNDSSSESFIGAKTVDWWVVNKIVPECHVAYEYIPLFEGLYEDKNGNIFTFTEQEQLSNVKKIIKQPYNKNKYSQYYEMIPFSISGSNASAAIISLVGQIGLMINTKESCIKEGNTRTTRFKKYFWFEPEKHEDPSNLRYSPNSSIESFSFDHSGNSLTTVLNVESNEINDEIVSLLPEVPPFFNSLFMSEDWKKPESTYFDGYFTSVCQQKILKNINTLDDDFYYSLSGNTRKQDYILIQLWTDNNTKKFRIPRYYDKISFKEDNNYSYVIYKNNLYDIYNTKWELCIGEDTTIGYNDTYNLINSKYLGTNQYVYLKIYIKNSDKSISLSGANIILNFSRDATKEELEFADIADKCPWLENKLIDFSYFYNNNIINKSEYNNLLSIFRNDLRIINGQLLVYAKQYYQAVHSATQIVSNIINDIDSLSAAFHADVVDSYSSGGKIGDISYFQQAYDVVNTKYFNPISNSILNYEELLTDYFNKYFNSQQRFLKNMYNFQKYFNEKIDWTGQNLYKHSVKLNEKVDYNIDGEYRYLSFDKPYFKELDNKFPYNRKTLEGSLNIYDSTKRNKVNTINTINKGDYFKIASFSDNIIKCDETSGYNSLKQYYRRIYKAGKNDKTWYNSYTIDQTIFVKYKEDDKFIYYGIQDLDINYNWPKTITLSGVEFKLDYIQVDLPEIINEYLYYKIQTEESNKLLGWTYHDNDTYKSATREYLFETHNNPLVLTLTPWCWFACFNKDDYEKYSEIKERALDGGPVYLDTLERFYVEHFPITTLRYKSPEYIKSPYTITASNQTYEIKYQRINEEGQTIVDYINYWKNKKPEDKEVKNPTEWFQTYDVTLVTPYNENQFYRRVFTPDRRSTFVLKKEGPNVGDMFGEVYDKFYYGYVDFDTINYGQAEDSFTKYKDYLKERKYDFINKLEEGKTELKGNLLENNVTIAEANGKFLNSVDPLPEEKKDYLSYYNLVGLTYTSMLKENNPDLKYKDSWLKILSSTSVLNKMYTYKMLLLSDKKINEEDEYFPYIFKNKSAQNEFLSQPIFSRIKYYPIDKKCEIIDLSFLDKNETISIIDLFKNKGYRNITINNNIISAQITENNIEWSKNFVVFQQIEYSTTNVDDKSLFEKDNKTLKCENRYKLYKNQTIYDDNKNVEVIFQNFKDLMQGFYTLKDQTTAFVKIEPNDNINDIDCYTQNGLKFERIYTIPQLLKLNSKFYYMGLSQEEDIENYSSTLTEINKPLYANKIIIKDNNINLLQTETVNKYTIEYSTNNKTGVIKYSNINGEVFDTEFSANSTMLVNFSSLTNGEFWYKYHSNPGDAILFENAAVIETNLTQYWEQAFIASKNCEFFLPEYWQNAVSGKGNYFNKDIIIANSTTGHVYLSNKFIPQVEIYKENGVSLLPLYSINHISKEQCVYDSKTTIINNENKQLASTVFRNNKVFQSIFKELNESLDQYEVQQIGDTNYYHRTSGGTRWENLVSTISSNSKQYDRLSGSYIMIYRILKSYLRKKTLTLYNDALRQHNNKWDEIYKNYSGVVLESKYENKDATTSEELFNLSTNAFKDLSQPERSYNVSIIDLASLSGYEGQELCIGDSILLDAEDYYEEYDDIKTTLSQYLFITDISYTLRKDSNISLTVNSIKYQEKLIQRLVKLIK